MATVQPHPLVRYVRALAAPSGTAGLTDAQLLERFAAEGDEAAFAALVSRHGPLVLGACRRVLRHWHDAEDCFQATFLVLARRAGSVRPRALSPWLHEVATRTALKARAQAARRRACERRVPLPPVEAATEEVVWRDLRPLLDEAIGRLPEKYRVPVVLCYLEGRTVAEVARQLGCPRGTVAARLARGRERLRARLVRRGVALSAAALVTVTKGAASARVPGPLVVSTARAAASAAARRAGIGLLSARVAALVQGVNRAMLMRKMRTAALWVVGAVLIGGGVGLSVVATRVAAQPIPRAETKPAPKAEGRASGGEDRPAAAKPVKVYVLALTVVKPDPHGEDLGSLGKGTILAQPTLSVPEGTEGSFLTTGNRYFIPKEIAVPGEKDAPAESLHAGTAMRVKVRSVSDGWLRLDAVWEQGREATGSEDWVQVCGTVVRAVARTKVGQSVKLVDKDDDGKVRRLARIKVVSEETVTSHTRSPAPTAKDVLVNVQEPGTGSLLFGVGVNSDAGLTGSVIPNERNFDIHQAPPAKSDAGTRLIIPALGPVPVSIDFGFPVRKE